MNMKLWNYLEKVNEMENKTFFFENYDYEQDPTDGSETHTIELNAVDDDGVVASYLIEAENKAQLKKQVRFMKSEYLEDLGAEIMEEEF